MPTPRKNIRLDIPKLLDELPTPPKAEYVKRLGKLAGLLERQCHTVNQRHSWGHAEKAASIADLLLDVKAVKAATAALIAGDNLA